MSSTKAVKTRANPKVVDPDAGSAHPDWFARVIAVITLLTSLFIAIYQSQMNARNAKFQGEISQQVAKSSAETAKELPQTQREIELQDRRINAYMDLVELGLFDETTAGKLQRDFATWVTVVHRWSEPVKVLFPKEVSDIMDAFHAAIGKLNSEKSNKEFYEIKPRLMAAMRRASARP